MILRHHKVVPLLPVEHSVTPHNVWDKSVELYGRNLDAFYPVADTEIGRLGFLMANEGSYPENARGLAMNGAEVVYRGPYPHPHVGNGLFEIQNRARALDNDMYLVACNVGTYYLRTVGHPDRHVRRRLGGDRLSRADRRTARLQRRVVLGGRDRRRGGASPVPGRRAVGRLDKGPHRRAVPAHLREAGLPGDLYLDRAPSSTRNTGAR